MLFSSMIFLWVFLPIVIIGNYILGLLPFEAGKKIMIKNRFLLGASLLFYAWGGIYYLALMLVVIVINFLGGFLVRKKGGTGKFWLVLTLASNLGILFYFKYFNLLVSTLEGIGNMESGALGFKEVVLPIGISFYIFQAMSYVIDVHLRKTRVQKNIFDFGLYVSLFPQLIAGPIVQYKDIEKQIYFRKESTEKFADGIRRFTVGLGKKVLIANIVAEAVDLIWNLEVEKIGVGIALLGTVAYTLQIYYDFSGYSDMAIGLGKMLGFDFKENFNTPYLAHSISEFWRRWHISLSSWFKEYVYIPLGGNRKGKLKMYLNLFIVFLLTGIWHGANYTFFIWGIYYAFFIILERALFGSFFDKHKAVGRIYTILVVALGWIFFRAPTVADAFSFIGGLFRFKAREHSVLQFLNAKMILALVFGILFAGPMQAWFGKFMEKNREKTLYRIGVTLAGLVFLIVSICMLTKGTYNPFIYFQF